MRKAGRGKALVDSLMILRLIASNRFGVSLAMIEEEINCSKRTAYRILKAFREIGIRIHSQRTPGHQRRWRLVSLREHLEKIGIV